MQAWPPMFIAVGLNASQVFSLSPFQIFLVLLAVNLGVCGCGWNE